MPEKVWKLFSMRLLKIPKEFSVVLAAKDSDADDELMMGVLVEVMGDGVLEMRDEKNDATLEATLDVSRAEAAVSAVVGEEARCSAIAAAAAGVAEVEYKC